MTGLSYVLAAAYWAAGIALAINDLRRTARRSERLADAAHMLGALSLIPHLRRLTRAAAEGIVEWLVVTVAALVMCWFALG